MEIANGRISVNVFPYSTLGDALRIARKTLNFTQSEIAAKCGITVTHLSLIENNKREPSITTLMAILKALDVHLALHV